MSKSFTLVGLRRSGNHPIIHWIMRCLNSGKILETDRSNDSIHYNSDRTIYFLNDWLTYKAQNFRLPREDLDSVLYSYEDLPLNYTAYFRDLTFTNIILLRDPLNNMASRIKDGMDQIRWYLTSEQVLERWKEYAREALNKTDNLCNKVVILYNKWVLDKEYRQQICSKLDIPFYPDTSYVPENGKGSSFIGRKLEEDLNRYNQRYLQVEFKDSDIKLLNDPELIELSSKLFPEINIKEFIENHKNE